MPFNIVKPPLVEIQVLFLFLPSKVPVVAGTVQHLVLKCTASIYVHAYGNDQILRGGRKSSNGLEIAVKYMLQI